MDKAITAPKGWEKATLGDLGVWSGGGTPSKANSDYWTGGNIPWVSPKDMKADVIHEAEDSITADAVANSAAKIIPANSLLMVTRSGILAHTFPVAINRSEVTVNQDLKTLTPSDAVSVEFLAWFLRSRNAEILGACSKNGTTVASIDTDRLKGFSTPVPPLAEQRRIVEKIETLFARLDKGEEAVRAVRGLLKRYRQSVLKAAVTGALTADWRAANANDVWPEINLGEVTEFLTSGSRGWASYYSEHGDMFIRAQNLKHDRLDLDDVAYVSLPDKSGGTRTLVRGGDILITITGANVTKSALVKSDLGRAYVSQHVALLRTTDAVNSDFLLWFLIAKVAGRKQLEEFAYGAGKPGLNLQNIRDVTLRLPSLEEQAVIVQRLSDAVGKIDAVETWSQSELIRSAALRQSILKDAFAGRLVAQNPTDEPASALLARIRAKSADKAGPKKRRKAPA